MNHYVIDQTSTSHGISYMIGCYPTEKKAEEVAESYVTLFSLDGNFYRVKKLSTPNSPRYWAMVPITWVKQHKSPPQPEQQLIRYARCRKVKQQDLKILLPAEQPCGSSSIWANSAWVGIDAPIYGVADGNGEIRIWTNK